MKKHFLTIAVVCLTGLVSCATPPPVTTGGYPTAKRTDNPDQVISPYEPFNVIDVAGFASGKLARDPSNQKIFRVP